MAPGLDSRCGIGLTGVLRGWVLSWLFLPLLVLAAGPWAGSPPFSRFAPDLDVFPQNFAITRDADGLVYVGNADGVLEFDGERWSLLRLPNRDLVRSLASVGRRVYVGGYNSFGYAEHDASGHLRYIELSGPFQAQLAGREFADIWDITVAPEGVYFRAVRDVFLWSPDTGKSSHWYRPQRFGALVHHDGRTLLQFREEGFRVKDGEEWRVLDGSAALTTLVYEMLPLADGDLLTLGSDGAWWRIGATAITPQPMPPGLPSSANFEHGLLLADGSLALASRDGQVALVDPTLARYQMFRLDSGFLSGVQATDDGGFLVISNSAVYRVSWPAAWSTVDETRGVDGSVYALADWQGQRYLATSDGAFRLNDDPVTGLRAVRAPWSDGTLYDLLPLGPDQALLARSHRLAWLEHGVVRDFSAELVYPRRFYRSSHQPQRVYLATEFGVRVIDLAAAVPTLSPVPNPDLATLVTSLVELGPDELLAGTERHGLWRYRYNANGQLRDAVRIDHEAGIETGELAGLDVAELADGRRVASTTRGLWIESNGRWSRTGLDGLESLRHPEELLHLLSGAQGSLWAYSHSRVLHRDASGPWHEHDIRTLRRGALVDARLGESGQLLLASGGALLLHNADVLEQPAQSPQVLLREVTRQWPSGASEPLPLDRAGALQLPQGEWGVQFRFALPDLAHAGERQYQGRLVGFESVFSEWSPSRGYAYWNLKPGTFRLEVRARDSRGRISEITPFTFTVVPPWYASAPAYAAYALMAALGLWFVVRRYVRWKTVRIARENARLEEVIGTRTRELEAANLRLDGMAYHDGLTGIANRRRFDSYLDEVWEQCRQRQRPLSLLLIDVDHFKIYNDSHGHLAGDELLKRITRSLAANLRRSEDLLARYGGEEFAVVLPGADAATAATLAEVLRAGVEAAALDATISVGYATVMPAGRVQVAPLIECADAGLYAAKHAGRNRISASPEPGCSPH